MTTTNQNISRTEVISAIEKHLEGILLEFCQAIQDRRLSPDEHPWKQHMDPNFSVTRYNPTKHEVNLQEYMDRMSNQLASWPEYNLTDPDFTYDVKLDVGKAMVFANFRVHGTPPGVVRTSSVIYRFRITDLGTWLCFDIHGIDEAMGTASGYH